MICVAEDAPGLRLAADELMEESFCAEERPAAQRAIEQSADPQAMRQALQGARTLSPGYYLWLGFVARTLERELEAGIGIHEREIYAEEAVALEVLKAARAEFRRKHPPCIGCGKLLANRWDKSCNDCQKAAAAAAMARG